MATSVSPRVRKFIIVFDRFSIHLARHWLVYAFIALAIFSGLPIVAPVAEKFGYRGISDVLYYLYSLTCHQLAYRSFFLFGAQSAYSLGELQQALNVSNPLTDVIAWHNFRGNAELGYKMAYCERDAAIYMTMAGCVIVFAFVRKRIRALSFRWFLVLITPLAIDGTWQLLSTMLIAGGMPNGFPLHESTALLRTVTGVLFGFAVAWWVYPIFDQAMGDLERTARYQLTRAERKSV